MNWLNRYSGSSAHTCVYAPGGVDSFCISILPPAGDLISSGLASAPTWANALRCAGSAALSLPTHPPSLIKETSWLYSLLEKSNKPFPRHHPSEPVTETPRMHKRKTPRETPNDAWPSFGAHPWGRGSSSWVLLSLLHWREGKKELFCHYKVHSHVMPKRLLVCPWWRSYHLWP